MATLNGQTLPPYATIEGVDIPVTRANFGGNYIAWPFVWVASYNGGLVGDYNASTPWGFAAAEMLDQYLNVDIVRGFYPPLNRLYDNTSKLGCLNMHHFLRLLDFWQAKGKKFHWEVGAFSAGGGTTNAALISGINQDSAAGEQVLFDAIKALFVGFNSTTSNTVGTGSKTFTLATGLTLTATNFVKIYSTASPNNFMWGNVTSYTSGTGALVVNVTNIGGSGTFADWDVQVCTNAGVTFKEHPALFSVVAANEQIIANGSYPAYARAVRIVTKLFEQYMPSVKVVTVTSNAGSRVTPSYELASAASLIPLASNGDDGIGKQACEYGYAKDCHHYHFNADSVVLHDIDIKNNAFVSRYNKTDKDRHLASMDLMTIYNPSSRLKVLGITTPQIKQWCTEWGMIGAATDPRAGGWGWSNATPKERKNNLIRSHFGALVSTSDGAGGFGIVFCYGFDGGGINGAGSSGTITNTTVGAYNGQVKFTLSGAPLMPFSSTLKYQTITITAGAGGWADLGLSAAQKGEFVMAATGGGTNEVYLLDTTYTAQPANNATYKEYQLDWAPHRTEWEWYFNYLTNNDTTGLVSWGRIHYPGAQYSGHWVNVRGKETYYTTADGEVRIWYGI